MEYRSLSIVATLILVITFQSATFGQPTSGNFSYQGFVKQNGVPANGNFQMVFEIYTAPTGGTLVFGVSNTSVAVTDGQFTVSLPASTLYFGPGANYWIETSLRPAGSTDPFTVLSPRQRILQVPAAISSLLSADSQRLGGLEPSQFVLTSDPRLTDQRAPTAGSGNYIQNSTSQQSSSNFNISGTGAAGIFNAASQYNIAGTRILSTPGTNNTFAGAGTGNANTTGNANSFFGYFAGESNSSGFLNSFFGAFAGAVNSTGDGNSFFGVSAGSSNTIGFNNAFFGRNAGGLNTNGSNNTIIGPDAGGNNVSGGNNTFVGRFAGGTNSTGSSNTMLGFAANSSSNNLSNATAIGANSFVSQSNSLVLGSINGVNGAASNTNVGIGTSAPAYPLDVQGRLRLRQPLPTNPGNTAGLFLARNDANGSPIDTAFVGMRDNTSVGFYSGQLVAWPLYVETDTGLVVVSNLGPAGSTQLCRNANNQIASCSSSIQYKDNVVSFGSGLDLIRKLRPVSFNWRNGGMSDVGLVAEEVAAVEPLLTTTNSDGKIEGVKYDRVGVVAINAINEQQAQIEKQSREISKQRDEIEQLKTENDTLRMTLTELRNAFCATNNAAAICKVMAPKPR